MDKKLENEVKDYRKNSEFKSKVLAQWKTSMVTESYFNY